MSDDIYREIILDHYRNPRNKGKLSNPDVSIHDSNPLCGDEIDIHLKVEEDKIKDITKEDILENIGLMNLGPARIKCALLSLKVLKLGMVKYYSDKDSQSAKELTDDSKLY